MRIRSGTFSRLERDAKLLIAVSGISAISFFGIQMLLKVLYILRLGHGPEYVGAFGASSALAYMAMGVPSGLLGRRFGTRTMMLVGGVGCTLGMAMLPLTEFAPASLRDAWPFFSQVALTLSWSMLNVNVVPALMAIATPDVRDAAYALTGAVRSLGMFLGTLFGGLLPGLFAQILGDSLGEPAPYRYALFVGAGLSALSLLPLVMIGQPQPRAAGAHEAKRGAFPLLPIALMVGYVYLRHAGWATCQAFCNAYMDTELQLSTSSIGLITGAGQFLAMLASLATPRLAARRGNAWTLVMTTMGIALSLLPMGLFAHWTAAGLGRLSILVLTAAWMPAFQVFQMELVESEWRSLAYGAVAMAMGLGFASTSLAGGYVIAAAGYRVLFLIGAALCAAASVVMWAIARRDARQRRTAPTEHSPMESQTAPP
ncbi:MAG TPA: MFS transporter [Anaerolineae bacterium]|nr:MFS transporter [Anaerolineae bacterium]